MNDYSGKICPYCKTPFQPNDEIVVCSECDMPHHKDCWVENQGCTTFGCLGTVKAVGQGASSVTATQMLYEDSGSGNEAVFCTQCGTRNTGSASFCVQCGSRLATASRPAPQPVAQPPVYTQANPASTNPYAYVGQQGVTYQTQNNYGTSDVDADMQRLIGTKSEYYIPKFREMKAQRRLNSWNWPAFLLGPYWLLYRKMYGFGAAAVGTELLFSLTGSTFLSSVSLGGYIALGILGNGIYMKVLEKKASQAKGMSEPYKSQFLSENGDVNVLAAVLTGVGRALLALILSLL